LGLKADGSPRFRRAAGMSAVIVAILKRVVGGCSPNGGEIPTTADERSACGGADGAAIVTGG
jgi:hypothetical protein